MLTYYVSIKDNPALNTQDKIVNVESIITCENDRLSRLRDLGIFHESFIDGFRENLKEYKISEIPLGSLIYVLEKDAPLRTVREEGLVR